MIAAAAGRADLRMPALGAVAWLAAIVALGLPFLVTVALLVAGACAVAVRRMRGLPVRTHVGWLVAGAAVAASAALHTASVGATPLTELAEQSAAVRGTLLVRSDPVSGSGAPTGSSPAPV